MQVDLTIRHNTRLHKRRVTFLDQLHATMRDHRGLLTHTFGKLAAFTCLRQVATILYSHSSRISHRSHSRECQNAVSKKNNKEGRWYLYLRW